jgi:hypothetical protein
MNTIQKGEKMAIDDGGPAFPQMVEHEQWFEEVAAYKKVILPSGGMSKRDYFAGLALQGFFAGCPWTPGDLPDMTDEDKASLEHVTKLCYVAADAMIAQGKKEK